MKFLFFFSLFTIFYVYLGYPTLISVIGLLLNRKVKKGSIQPLVTILIAAYNEERDIEKTIKNKLELEYPKEKLKIIVISDGSTDKTDEIVRRYESEAVRLIRQEPRAGKASALNMGVGIDRGEIVAFSDANSMWSRSTLKNLIRNFNDPEVGYVTGKMVYGNPGGSIVSDGCSGYMKYENLLRELETKVGSVVGVDGGIDAIRKSLYQPMRNDQLPDFVLPLKVVEQGYRVVYEPMAILSEHALKDAKDEYKMRVRVNLRALWALRDMRKLLSVRKYGLFAWQMWSHKLLRYLCFLFLGVAFGTNLALWPVSIIYKIVFVLQCLAYLCAVLYPVLRKLWFPFGGLYLLNYFALLNLAAGHAFLKFLMGQKQAIWTPRKG